MFKNLLPFLMLITSSLSYDYINYNECLATGQKIVSPNKCFALMMQYDGNLVLYRVSDAKVMWFTNTQDKGTFKACMQEDGNFVTYAPNGRYTWASNTVGNNKASLKLQDDGNLVMNAFNSKDMVWSTKTQMSCN
ncbi:unnamed protein product [Chironomus riparius]|uniref:Bulb-type lectin domain-containing protein n=1 Tax=Chironomus riparius TaxID=315576 RepID=A0A9N9RGI1_9DIPT|nr:unnamed protein product [Chironomus riparius]